MIIVKPKPATLISIGMFIALSMAGGLYGLVQLINDVHARWYSYVLAIVLLPLGLGLFLRMLWNYKIIRIAKGKFDIHYPIRMKRSSFTIKDVHYWREETIKTASGTYRELQIFHAEKHKLDISMQEHTRYMEALKYLRSKCASKQKGD